MNVLEYLIRAKDETEHGIGMALARLKNFAVGVGRNLMNIQAGFQMLAGAVHKFAEAFSDSLNEQQTTYRFKNLIGSMDEAKKHMEMLDELGRTPPFSDKQFAAASSELMKMTDGTLGYRKELEMLADYSAATGVGLTELAHAFGLAYTTIRDGEPLSRASMELVSMGVITKATAKQWDKLQEVGDNSKQIWNQLIESLSKYKGAQDDVGKTAKGSFEKITSELEFAKKKITDAVLNDKGIVGTFNKISEKLKQLNDDGTIDFWASRTAKAFEKVTASCSKFFSNMKEGWSWEQKVIGGAARFWGALSGGASYNDALKAMDAPDANANPNKPKNNSGAKSGSGYKNSDRPMDTSTAPAANAQAQNGKGIGANGGKKVEEEIEEAAAIKKRLADWDDLVKQAWTDMKVNEAEEKRKHDLNEKTQADDKKRELRRLNGLKDDADPQLDKAKERYEKAKDKVKETWGWYRDPKKFKEQLTEEKNEARAQEKFKKDAERFKEKHPDWLNNDKPKLSNKDEAVRRVLLAREEEKNSKKQLSEISENLKTIVANIKAVNEE